MYRIYAVVAILFLMLLLVASYVALAKNRHGILSLKEVSGSIATLLLLVLGAFLCCWAAFALAGGPDGRFLSGESLGYGALLIAAALAIVLFALRLLSVPARWAALFLAPAALATAGAAIENWPVTLAAFTAGPVLCLVLIVVLWLRGELKAIAL